MAATTPNATPDHHLPGAADRVPHDMFIAGRWQSAAGAPMAVINPATEAVIAEVADATEADARRALRAAADAQADWAATPARTRSEILYRTYQLMLDRTDLLAAVMTLEMGKPLRSEDYTSEPQSRP